MKRFFCSTCQKQKRVRILPPDYNSMTQNGTCRFHATIGTRDKTNSRERVFDHFGSTRKISASSQKTKSKKG